MEQKDIHCKKDNIKIRPFYYKGWFLFLLNSLIFLFFAWILPIRFETNDDILMLLISSGDYSGIPDAHLVFINYIYGILVSHLYLFIPEIEWYTVFFIFIHIVSLTIISFSILNSKKKTAYKIAFTLILYMIEIWIVLNFQFTTTAAICAMASVVLFNYPQTKYKIIAVILFLLASLIRFEAAFLVLIMSGPLFLFEYFNNPTIKLKQNLILLSLFFILPVTAKYIDIKIYSKDKQWDMYKEYNFYRGLIHDNPNIVSEKDLPETVYESDYLMLRLFFPDTQIVDIDVLKSIYFKANKVEFKQKLINIYYNVLPYKFLLSCILIFSIIQIFIIKGRINVIILVGAIGLFFLLLFYISIDATLKPRVFVSALLAFCWLLFYMQNNNQYRNRLDNIGLIFLYIFLLIGSIYIGRRLDERKTANDTTEQESLIENIKLEKTDYMISFGDALKFENYSPFKISNLYKKYPFLTLGWYSMIPFNKNRLESHTDIIDKNAILISKDWATAALPNLRESIKLHYNTDVEFTILSESKHYFILRLRKVN
ncbi:hypothetical protein [Prevotella sp. 10(H)]|uniref:hypothetical protein n=1 Tax=Prevotella sp. 10(H) TaxID=1158294 RepID=UPI0004A6F66C|nr:hypothetical protein [Prevotella sp. 10(H)]